MACHRAVSSSSRERAAAANDSRLRKRRAEVSARAVVWLRRDLRLEDNAAIFAACREHDQVALAFVLNPPLLASPRMGAPLVCAFFDALAALRESLREMGSDLVLLRGDFAGELTALAERLGAGAIYFSRDTNRPRSRRCNRHCCAARSRYPRANRARPRLLRSGRNRACRREPVPHLHAVQTPLARTACGTAARAAAFARSPARPHDRHRRTWDRARTFPARKPWALPASPATRA